MASAELDARLLVGSACGLDHAGLIRHGDQPLGVEAAARLSAMIARRLAHEPVSRILGTREFWGLPFLVGPGVLDPRADTERLVAVVLEALAGRLSEPLRVLDLGTGSGAILAALLHEMPAARGVGVDQSTAACRIAGANLAALGLASRSQVICGSWSDPLRGVFDAIVSNPPYIASHEIAALAPGVRDYDPRQALDGGGDGLEAYRALLPGLVARLAPGGTGAVECGWSQAGAVATLCRSAGLSDVGVARDLAGHDRVVFGTVSR